jgi:hypothetical protein
VRVARYIRPPHASLTPLCSVDDEWKDRVAIATEDYLHGVISLVNELVGFN